MREWLIQIRKINGYSQKEVAEKCGISRSCYAGYESGNRTPAVPIAKSIAAVLGFNWTLFYEDNGRESRREKSTA